MSLQFIENELEKNPQYLEENETARNLIFNNDYTLRDEVKVGYFHYVYMGLCSHCYEAPCKDYKYHPLYEQYREKYIQYENYTLYGHDEDEDVEDNLFMFQHTHYINIQKASKDYILNKQREILNDFTYPDLVNIIIEYL